MTDRFHRVPPAPALDFRRLATIAGAAICLMLSMRPADAAPDPDALDCAAPAAAGLAVDDPQTAPRLPDLQGLDDPGRLDDVAAAFRTAGIRSIYTVDRILSAYCRDVSGLPTLTHAENVAKVRAFAGKVTAAVYGLRDESAIVVDLPLSPGLVAEIDAARGATRFRARTGSGARLSAPSHRTESPGSHDAVPSQSQEPDLARRPACREPRRPCLGRALRTRDRQDAGAGRCGPRDTRRGRPIRAGGDVRQALGPADTRDHRPGREPLRSLAGRETCGRRSGTGQGGGREGASPDLPGGPARCGTRPEDTSPLKRAGSTVRRGFAERARRRERSSPGSSGRSRAPRRAGSG